MLGFESIKVGYIVGKARAVILGATRRIRGGLSKELDVAMIHSRPPQRSEVGHMAQKLFVSVQMPVGILPKSYRPPFAMDFADDSPTKARAGAGSSLSWL